MVLASLRSHLFLFALVGALAVGFVVPQSVLRLEEIPGLRGGLVATVLFLMGLTVPTKAFKSVIRSPIAGILAIGLNVVLVPGLAAIASLGLTQNLGGGLIVAAAAPCTLASAIVWTRRGGGDEAVAMLVTVVTNFFCFLIAPVTLLLLLGESVPINFSNQAIKLGSLVVFPLMLAQLIRQNDTIGRWTIEQKKRLTNVSLAGILTMVALGAAHSVPNSPAPSTAAEWRQDAESQGLGSTTSNTASAPAKTAIPLEINQPQESGRETFGAIALMVLAAVVVHCGALGAGWFIAGKMRLPKPQQTAVAISGSQKTLMVGLQLAIDCSVSTVPMVAYHLCQLLIDTLFASKVANLARGAGSDGDNHASDCQTVKNDAEQPE